MESEPGKSIGAVLLCGGQSRRMGSDKALLQIASGEPLLSEIIRRLAAVISTNHTVVSARRGQALPSLRAGVSRVDDSVDDQGPMAGIVSGLTVLEGRVDLALVLAVDSPAFIAELIPLLAESIGTRAAAVPRVGQQIYPLTALYQVSQVLPLAARRLARGELRVIDWAAECEPVYVEETALRQVDPTLASLAACNTPQEWAALGGATAG